VATCHRYRKLMAISQAFEVNFHAMETSTRHTLKICIFTYMCNEDDLANRLTLYLCKLPWLNISVGLESSFMIPFM
jgi:hypothetical protein